MVEGEGKTVWKASKMWKTQSNETRRRFPFEGNLRRVLRDNLLKPEARNPKFEGFK
jgi:hypothetical protein